MSEQKKGEHMMRAWVDADLGDLIHSTVELPERRHVLENELVAHSLEMFELGRAWERGEIRRDEGSSYLRGFFDAIEIIEIGGTE